MPSIESQAACQTIGFEEDMPFSEENQKWILDQIEQAVHPNGWEKVAERLRYWGLLGLVVSAFLAMIGIVITLAIFSANGISVESEFRGRTDAHFQAIDQHLETIDKRLDSIDTTLQAIRLQLAAGNPRKTASQSEAKNILALAKA
ncbi:MAG: hypothetical protein ACRDF4_08800, partial [Rhabdochlamydiaceae bacterium]